jgi:hypothetical protein
MAESHVVSGLIAKRAEVAGRVLKLQEELNRLCRDLVHLDATIKLFAPEFNTDSIKPRNTRERAPLLNHGEISRFVLDAFRELDRQATTRQIVDAIHDRKGIDATTEAIGAMQKRVNSYLKRNPEHFRMTGRDKAGSAVWEMML